jgi:hypothetical protein
MLHMEKARARASLDAQALSVAHPFHLLNDLEDYWNDEGLKAALFDEMQDSDLLPAEYAALMDALLKAGYEPAIEDAVARIDILDESTIAIADVLLRRAPAAVWRLLWPKLLANDALSRAVLTRVAGRFYHSPAFYAGIGADAIADLYLLMVRLFPSEADPGPASGFVGPLQMVTSLRDDAVRCLAAMGTEEAVRALRRLVAERPDIPLLPFELSHGELEMRLKTWSPLITPEIFALTDRPDARLVTSAGDLMEILLKTLAKLEAELHGAQTPVRGLWDLQPNKSWRPIEEDGLSNAVAIYLTRELASVGIFANREVEVVRKVGAPIGRRTDILSRTPKLRAAFRWRPHIHRLAPPADKVPSVADEIGFLIGEFPRPRCGDFASCGWPPADRWGYFGFEYAAIGTNNWPHLLTFSVRCQSVDGVASLRALLVRADLADALEDIDLDALFGEAREEAADGVRRLAHRFGDPLWVRSFTAWANAAAMSLANRRCTPYRRLQMATEVSKPSRHSR